MAKKSISNTACFSVKPHHPLCRIDEVKREFYGVPSVSLAPEILPLNPRKRSLSLSYIQIVNS